LPGAGKTQLPASETELLSRCFREGLPGCLDHGRDMLVADLVLLPRPADRVGLKVDIRPAEQADRVDPVTGGVGDDQQGFHRWADARCRGQELLELIDVPLEKSGVTAENVLVGECAVCGAIASIPQQSAARLKEVRRPVARKTEVRIPRELQDVLYMIATEFGGVPKAFSGAVVRYYLRQARHDNKLAKRLARLGKSPEAEGAADARLSFGAPESWYEDLKRDQPAIALPDRSTIVRGAIVAAKRMLSTNRGKTCRGRSRQSLRWPSSSK
jgi:hypothetical protein